jgi:predicted glycosyltransferase
MTGFAEPRFIFYSHDGVGLGHFRRNLVLARALIDQDRRASVLLACAAEGLETFSLPLGVDLLRLPGLRKLGNGRYTGRRLSLETSELLSLRAGLIASAVDNFHPDVLLADKYPIGVHGELLPALQLLRERGARAALGLRDVLDDPVETANEWASGGLGQHVAEMHDLVLVYGSPGFLNPVSTGLLPAAIHDRVRFCGYVAADEPASRPKPRDLPGGDGQPLVLASVGGGEDGRPVLKAFIEASRGAPWRGVIVAGPQMESSRWRRLQEQALEADVFAYRAVPSIHRWLPHLDALVCMGGYNTLVEAASAGVPTVCIPRTRPRQEQLIRARAFAARGLLHVVEPESLTRSRLAGAIADALETPRAQVAARARMTLDLHGSRRASAHLLELARTAVAPAAAREALARRPT